MVYYFIAVVSKVGEYFERKPVLMFANESIDAGCILLQLELILSYTTF